MSKKTKKTDEQLFEEVSNALINGGDINDTLKDVEIVEQAEPAEHNDDPVVPAPEGEEASEGQPVEEEEAQPEGTPGNQPAVESEAEKELKRLREEKAQLEHRLQSFAGRVPALQREVEELKRQRQAAPAQPAAADAPSVAKSKLDEKLARAKEIDPELVDLLETLRDELSTGTRKEIEEKVSKTEQMLREKEEEAYWHAQKARLLELVPQADEVFKSPLWREWKEQQSGAVYALASSSNADEMYYAMELFARDAAKRYPNLAPTQQPSEPAAPNPAIAKITEDRNRKLVSAPSTGSAGVPKQGKGIPDENDPEALFNYVVGKLQKGEALKL